MPESNRITKIVPMPRSVAIAGRDFCVHQCRISDLADLQDFLDAQCPDPVDLAGPRAFDPDTDEDEREALLSAVNDSWDEPPTWGSDEAWAAYSTTDGLAYLLWVMLRRGQPDLSPGGCVPLMEACSQDEFERLRRAFFAIDAIGIVRRSMPLLADLLSHGSGGVGVPWGQAIDDVARSHGWTYQYIYSLTLDEFRNARSHGEERDGSEITWATYQRWMQRRNDRIAKKIEAQNRVGADTENATEAGKSDLEATG